jgi:hypothetical protein
MRWILTMKHRIMALNEQDKTNLIMTQYLRHDFWTSLAERHFVMGHVIR